MVKNAVSKVMWLGRATVFLVGLAVILALVFGFATTALGANGDTFDLGRKNVASQATRLFADAPGASLFIQNNGDGPGATALNLRVRDGQPPMKTNSDGKVNNLNADMVDGLTAEELRGQKGDKGDTGDPGQSVTSETLSSGDANCLNGGSKFTSASGDTFACTGDTGPAGANGENGINGANGADGAKGDKGDTGEAGSAVAYANVFFNGTVAPTRSKNLTSANVTKPDGTAGVFCIHGLAFEPRNAVGNVIIGAQDLNAARLADVVVSVSLGESAAYTNNLGCPANTTVVVQTFDPSDEAFVNVSFNVWLED